MVDQVLVKGEEIAGTLVAVETYPPTQLIMGEGNISAFRHAHELIAELFEELIHSWVLERFVLDNMGNRPHLLAIFHDLQSALGKHQEGSGQLVGEIFIAHW